MQNSTLAAPPAPRPAELDELLAPHTPPATSPFDGALALAWSRAPYLRRLMRTRTATLAALLTDGCKDALAGAEARATGFEPVDARLRAAKADVALVTAVADLAGTLSLERFTGALSRFADLALDQAIAAAIRERVPDAEPAGLTALALGKLGSGELNYSSDVDLIFLHDRRTLPRRPRDDPDEAAVRIARRVVEIMQGMTSGSYVFRVDLRLRPSPEATAISLPVEAAESYYHSEALTWERAAFIRARACAGDVALGQGFLDAIRPFVWRRSLDYSAIRDIQEVSLRIRDHFAAGQEAGPGFDLKRGRGGIREVEFFAQLHQLIFGGREQHLRTPATLDALDALASAGRIDAGDAATLAAAYRHLRHLEHRVQMRADEQTHRLPESPEACAEIAAFCAYPDWDALHADLLPLTRAVGRTYDRLIVQAKGSTGLPGDADALAARLSSIGFESPEPLAALIEGWRSGRYRALRAEEARRRFEAVLPKLLAALRASVDPEVAARRLDAFLAQLPAGVQFFALLEANPRLVDLLGRLLGLTPALADALARAPELFDVLLGPEAFAPLPDADALAEELRLLLGRAPQLEDALDRVRRWTAERRFQIGAQLVEGLVDPLDAARAYSALADAAFRGLVPIVEDAFAEAHGRVNGASLVVLGLGRFGGQALTPRSDLDIVYLFTGSHDRESDGRRPLAATAYFNRLAQRVTAALSVPTAAGALYEIDTRLRPQGAQGLLSVTVDSFAAYQRDQAWTWEHMALTRARLVLGDGTPVEAVIDGVLHAPRDLNKLRADVVAMRAEMAAHKPGDGIWDVKLAPGGLVDLEFVVHYLQLRERTAFTPDLAAACRGLIDAGLLAPDILPAHDLLTRLLVILRLLAPSGEPPQPVRSVLATACGQPDHDALVAALGLAKRAVLGAWEAAFGQEREGI
jgi:glutamate-ammonia-ligase adenylyltransferase